jgi:hypothetical protein
MQRRKLKLFIWRGVLTDYTDGLAVALAYSAKQAVSLLRAESVAETGVDFLDGRFDGVKLDGVEPEVFSSPVSAHVHGGG